MPDAASPYEYGTEPQPGTPDHIYIVPTLLSEVLGDWAEPLASAIPYLGQMSYETHALCSTPPPVVSADLNTMVGLLPPFHDPAGAADHIEKLVRQHIWPEYCQPVAAAPGQDPLPPAPPPVEPTPPGVDTPLPPPIADPHEYAMMRILMEIKLRADWLVDNTVTLDYTFGPTFSMEGLGDHQDDEAIGWRVHTIFQPSTLGWAGGTPRVTFTKGWIDFGDQNGWFDHRRLFQDDAIFFPCRFYTRMLGWDLSPGVVCQGRALYKGDGPHSIGTGG